MKGFRDFIMRGNLVELAVAFIMAAAFAAVVKAFTGMVMDLIGKIGGTPNFSSWTPGGVGVGTFITALISFLIIALIVYFFIVKPYQAAKAAFTTPDEASTAEEIALLREIRDLLRGSRDPA